MVHVTDPHTTDFATCSRPDCEVIAQRNGLCSQHYMAQYHQTRATLRDEVLHARAQYGPPDEYFCEQGECPNPASRWWVKDGDTPIAICADHAQEQVDTYRMEIRRLELK